MHTLAPIAILQGSLALFDFQGKHMDRGLMIGVSSVLRIRRREVVGLRVYEVSGDFALRMYMFWKGSSGHFCAIIILIFLI
jgi:hypothetical protein